MLSQKYGRMLGKVHTCARKSGYGYDLFIDDILQTGSEVGDPPPPMCRVHLFTHLRRFVLQTNKFDMRLSHFPSYAKPFCLQNPTHVFIPALETAVELASLTSNKFDRYYYYSRMGI